MEITPAHQLAARSAGSSQLFAKSQYEKTIVQRTETEMVQRSERRAK